MKGKREIYMFLALSMLCINMLCSCSSGNGYPPKFSYEGKAFIYSGHDFAFLPENYQLLGMVEEALQTKWDFNGTFGSADSPVYLNSDHGNAILVCVKNSEEYKLFVTKELISYGYAFVKGRLYRDTYRQMESLPSDFILYGTIWKQVFDKIPDEELSGGITLTEYINGNVFVSNQNDNYIYIEAAQYYPGIYHEFERIN